ncbi:MAG: hypothetical protein P4L91_11880 [Burkholderiaceae bacterium]|nr:hypothetical protein [Burkholderiaceae bacterium]
MQAATLVQRDTPDSARDWLLSAGGLLDRGDADNARTALRRAAALAGDDAPLYRALALGYRAAGMADDANTAEMAALAFEQRSALMLYNIGTSFLMTQRPTQAVQWYRAALRIDADLVAAHQNLASILELHGSPEEARLHRDHAYGRQNVFIDSAAAPKRTVLVLCAAATGNVPFDFLLPRTVNTRIRWVMEYASEDQIDRLPAFDLVFNAIGDQDVSARSADAVRRFLQRCNKPLLNRPESIARTSREQIPALLADIDHLVVPPAMRLSGAANRLPLADRLRDGGIFPPLLMRPVGSHGGVGLQMIESAAALAALKLEAHDYYACDYRHYCSADGYFRKYRVIFIDGEPYPYHLAISRHWLVHYLSAEMLPHAWKRAEEQRFLDDPATVLGPAAMQALRAIGQRMNLDFCGIDFSLLEDGRILLFEANATMLVHLEQFHAALQFRNPYVQRILDAFDRMLDRRAEVSR